MVVGLTIANPLRVRLYNLLAQNRTRSSRLLGNHNGTVICRTFCGASSSGDGSGDKKDDNSPDEESTPSSATQKTGRRRSVSKPQGDPTLAKSKLNDLLKSIVKDQEQRMKSDHQVQEQQKPIEKQIQFKLARQETPRPTPAAMLAAEQEMETTKQIGKDMFAAVKKVAKSIPGDPQAVESELVKKLKSHSSSKVDLSELFEGMTVDKDKKARPDKQQDRQDREPSPSDFSRAGRVRKEMGSRDRSSISSSLLQNDRRARGRTAEEVAELSYRPIDIFGSKPLGIFTKAKSSETPSAPISYLKTWDALHQKDLKLSTTHPPANGFEEMILWTEQGKLWHFPIDNEQGLDIEAKVSFADHVFLEPHLEGWCPKKGPIRHFMELVCIGLSKNSYLTVEEKKHQIEWYHQYFLNKASIIKEVGAGEIK